MQVDWLVLRHIRILEKQEGSDARECWYLRRVVGVVESLCPHVPTASYRYTVDGPTLVPVARYSCFCIFMLRILFTYVYTKSKLLIKIRIECLR